LFDSNIYWQYRIGFLGAKYNIDPMILADIGLILLIWIILTADMDGIDIKNHLPILLLSFQTMFHTLSHVGIVYLMRLCVP